MKSKLASIYFHGSAMEVASFSSFIHFHKSFYLLASTSREASTDSHGSWMEIESRSASKQVVPAPMEAINYLHVLPNTSMEIGNRPASTEVAPAQG